MVVGLAGKAAHALNEVLGLAVGDEVVVALDAGEVRGSVPTIDTAAFYNVRDSVLIHFLQFLLGAHSLLSILLIESSKLSSSLGKVGSLSEV